MFNRCINSLCLLPVIEKFIQLIEPTTHVFSPIVIKVVSYLYAVSIQCDYYLLYVDAETILLAQNTYSVSQKK